MIGLQNSAELMGGGYIYISHGRIKEQKLYIVVVFCTFSVFLAIFLYIQSANTILFLNHLKVHLHEIFLFSFFALIKHI
jgi:hypothetical protein